MEHTLEFLRKIHLICKNFKLQLKSCGCCQSIYSAFPNNYVYNYNNMECDENGVLYAEVYDGENWFIFEIDDEGSEHLEKLHLYKF